MSGPEKNTNAYSASDIQRYLKGEMSAREMHHLEKAALEDPFLADAIEGFESQPVKATPDTNLDDLRTRLHTRSNNPAHKKIFPITPWLKIAAAVTLLIGLGTIAWYTLLNNNQQKESLATTTQKTAPQAPATPTADAAPTDSTTPSGAITPAASAAALAKSPAAPSADSSAAPRTAPVATTTQPLSDSLEKQITSDFASANAAEAPPIASGNQKDKFKSVTIRGTKTFSNLDSTAYNSSAQSFSRRVPDSSPHSLTGRVLDANNNAPLAGAVLRLSGNANIATVTDQQGRFNLSIPKDSDLRITIGAMGYESASLEFNKQNTQAANGNIIHLQQQNNSLDEVVVVGYGAKRKETRALAPAPNNGKLDSSWERAAPIIGKQAYLDYLAAHKRSIGADSSIKGTVIVSFDINKKGTLTSFKVEQSLTPAHDAGIIRLVSEGPAWKVIKGRSVRTVVRVVF